MSGYMHYISNNKLLHEYNIGVPKKIIKKLLHDKNKEVAREAIIELKERKNVK